MAKVLKRKLKMKGKFHTFWQVDGRSFGKGQISKNPNTNERFESKKEAQAYLDELAQRSKVEEGTEEGTSPLLAALTAPV